ncbi:glutathione S-transferase [Neisseria sp. HSC-16F19]|nr:glutathione S-transferase family protein [Neisseria sp. HSC-16F19]MCP2041299.1 glutathione S-transferase [Neisseria sp. HSC-16F19]
MIILTTLTQVPDFAVGFVRDIRIRWALEEAGLPYRVVSVPPGNRDYRAQQPFGQVPLLQDGSVRLFESGAILLHVGGKSPQLLPQAEQARADAVSWLFAALNTVETVTYRLFRLQRKREPETSRWHKDVQATLNKRLTQLEQVLQKSEWLAGTFSIADIAMADVLRLSAQFGALSAYPACGDYVQRATARPAFVRAYQDQLAHFGHNAAIEAAVEM